MHARTHRAAWEPNWTRNERRDRGTTFSRPSFFRVVCCFRYVGSHFRPHSHLTLFPARRFLAPRQTLPICLFSLGCSLQIVPAYTELVPAKRDRQVPAWMHAHAHTNRFFFFFSLLLAACCLLFTRNADRGVHGVHAFVELCRPSVLLATQHQQTKRTHHKTHTHTHTHTHTQNQFLRTGGVLQLGGHVHLPRYGVPWLLPVRREHAR
jgi:hypothetical protein